MPQAAAAPAASLERMNSSLVLASLARWYDAPRMGERTASSTPWLKAVPSAMAEGLTGGRSGMMSVRGRKREERIREKRTVKRHCD